MNLEERLQNLQAQLRLAPQKTRKDQAHRRDLERQITNLKAFLSFSEGMRVSKGEELGTISQLSLSNGGMPEAWVKWDDSPNLPSPETPSKLTPVSIVTVIEELSHDEQRQLVILERKIERALQGFYEAGMALKEIRDHRLYRSSHKTFEEYCLDRFGFTRMSASYKISAAKVIENLSTIGLQSDSKMCADGLQDEMRTNGLQDDSENLSTNGLQILPTSERQVRPLTSLDPDQQREAWKQAVNQSGGKSPTGKIVKSIVDQIRERRPVPNPWRVGDVVSILVKDNPDLKGKAGCWAIVTEVLDFSCIVRMWDGYYQVKIENLKELPYSPQHKQQLRELSDRLGRIYSPPIEEIARTVLSSLGKINRPFLTELEEQLLKVLEEKIRL